jgi:hypothetical protein
MLKIGIVAEFDGEPFNPTEPQPDQRRRTVAVDIAVMLENQADMIRRAQNPSYQSLTERILAKYPPPVRGAHGPRPRRARA